MRFSFVTLVLGSLLSLAGCVSDVNGALACSDIFTPCGGALEGVWSFDTGCNVGTLAALSCGVTSGIAANATGTYAFNADTSYALNLMVDETGTVTYPASCVTGAAACNALTTTSYNGGLATASTCSPLTNGDCQCAVTVTGAVTDTGTYTTSGDDFTTASATSGATSPAAGYCVTGAQLQLAGGVMGAGSADVYTLFTRQ